VRDHLADGRCSRAVLDFLSSTDVGRRVPAEAEDDAVSAVSELEEREWLEEQGAGAEEPGAGGTAVVPAHTRLHGVLRNSVGMEAVFSPSSFPLSYTLALLFCSFLL